MQLVLSLFPGIGMLDMAFEMEGFTVVRGPDVLWGGDIRTFHVPAGRFDGLIGGPPCQMFSSLAHMVRHNGFKTKFGNLIPEFERVISEAQPTWWLMENVPQAPLPSVLGYEAWSCKLDNRQLGEVQRRIRRWTFAAREKTVLQIETVALMNQKFSYAACGGGGSGGVGLATVDKFGRGGRPKSVKELRSKQRLDSCVGSNIKSSVAFRALCRAQGLPDDFELPPFKIESACKAIGNGVPIAMGRAIAAAVRLATNKGTANGTEATS